MTMDDTWIYVMDEAALREGSVVPVYPLGLNLILARIEGQSYALSGRCPHMGCPLFMGTVDSGILTCPCHDWRFDLRTGRFLDAPELGLKLHRIRSDEGKLYVTME